MVGLMERRRMMMQAAGTPLLPTEYQQVEYVENNKTAAYIDTGIVPRNTHLIVEYRLVSRTASTAALIVGKNETSQNYRAVYIQSTNYYAVYERGSSGRAAQWAINTSNKHTIEYNNENHEAVYDGSVKATKANFACTDGTTTIKIFNSTVQFRVYALQMIDNDTGTVLGNFIPCYRKQDGEVGFYDTITKSFFSNASDSGELTYG